MEKTAVAKTPIGVSTQHELKPGKELHTMAMQDIKKYHDLIVGNRLYIEAAKLIKVKPEAKVGDLFAAINSWNAANPKGAITVVIFENLMDSIAKLLGVEKIYDEEATRVRSKFNTVASGIYKSLSGMGQTMETGVKTK